jgi:hypothetical protein
MRSRRVSVLQLLSLTLRVLQLLSQLLSPEG